VEWLDDVWARILPDGEVPLAGAPLAIVAVVALLVVSVRPVWEVLRLGVTLVHELGHAGVGVLCGRRFTGFVLRGDMSGHAVTVGPARGLGRTLTTWAGYPAPAIVAVGLVRLGFAGWAPTVLTGVIAVLLFVLLRSRSLLTVGVVVTSALAAGAVWWAGSDLVQAQVVIGTGVVLLVGAWRHLGAVLRGADSGTSDPATLARLTGVPRVIWLATFALVCGWATVVVVTTVWAAPR
jgi:hypothetical protein